MQLRQWLTVLACIGACAVCAGTHAQTYPNRSVRLIVGPPGGAADIVARTVGQKLSEMWGQQVVVDNRVGAGGTIGAEIAAKAAPDGYTILMISASHAISAGLYKTSYKPLDSFAPVVLIASATQVLLANRSLQAKSIDELVALAKAEPGKLSYGSAGTGSTTHLAGELFISMAGIKIVHVPYKGGPPSLTDLMGGQIPLAMLSLPAGLPHIKSGQVRALGVTALKRSPALPQVPAIAEALPGYEATNWYGIIAPKGTSPAIVEKLHAAIVTALQSPAVVQSIVSQGAEVVGGSTPLLFTAYLRSEIDKWTKIIKAVGVRQD
jgi:tripartite-type tricarboxylate transporter receptor subunit TctC